MSNAKKAALEYATERVPESAKFKEQIIVGNHLREEIHDAFIRGYEACQEEHEEKVNELLSALEQIANATQPFNAFENEVFVSVATDIARKALSFYNAT